MRGLRRTDHRNIITWQGVTVYRMKLQCRFILHDFMLM